MSDPWNQMAVELQFRALVEPPHGLEPATLRYLQEAQDGLVDKDGQYVNQATDILVVALDKGRYARALATMVWGDTPFETAMGLTVDGAGPELLSAARSLGSPDSLE